MKRTREDSFCYAMFGAVSCHTLLFFMYHVRAYVRDKKGTS